MSDDRVLRLKLCGVRDARLHRQAPDSGEWLLDLSPTDDLSQIELSGNEIFDLRAMAEAVENMT